MCRAERSTSLTKTTRIKTDEPLECLLKQYVLKPRTSPKKQSDQNIDDEFKIATPCDY
jgi:hypothetical protein